MPYLVSNLSPSSTLELFVQHKAILTQTAQEARLEGQYSSLSSKSTALNVAEFVLGIFVIIFMKTERIVAGTGLTVIGIYLIKKIDEISQKKIALQTELGPVRIQRIRIFSEINDHLDRLTTKKVEAIIKNMPEGLSASRKKDWVENYSFTYDLGDFEGSEGEKTAQRIAAEAVELILKLPKPVNMDQIEWQRLTRHCHDFKEIPAGLSED